MAKKTLETIANIAVAGLKAARDGLFVVGTMYLLGHNDPAIFEKAFATGGLTFLIDYNMRLDDLYHFMPEGPAGCKP